MRRPSFVTAACIWSTTTFQLEGEGEGEEISFPLESGDIPDKVTFPGPRIEGSPPELATLRVTLLRVVDEPVGLAAHNVP
jgi:hypothetical protein